MSLLTKIQCVITSECVKVLGWLNILQIPVLFFLRSWMIHCPSRLRPDKIEGSGVIDEDGVETDVGPCGVDDDVNAEVRSDKVDDGVED